MYNKITKVTLTLMLFMTFFTLPVLAAPNLQGETGNLVTPSADLMRQGEFHVALIKAPKDTNAYAIAVALDNNVELSAIHQDKDTLLGLKYAVVGEKIALPGIALGVSDLTGKYDRSYYLVISKTLPLGFRLHGGIGTNQYKKGMLALEAKLNPTGITGVFPDTSLFVENINSEIAYGIRVSILRGLKASLTRYDKENNLNISYNFY